MLRNYQKALRHKSEPKTNLTFINCVIMVYELRARTIETHKSIDSLRI